MKIAYIAFCDNKGGAARGAYRLHKGLLSHGYDSHFIVRRKYSNDNSVHEYRLPLSDRKRKFNDWLSESLYPKLRDKYVEYQSFCLRHTGLDEYINAEQFDLVIMHWIGGDTLSIKEVGNIKCPIIWRLADEWAFNGSVHYALDDGWKTGYPKRPLLDDPNAFVWHRKLRFWSHKKIHFICGSHWLSSRVKESKLFGQFRVKTIPSSLETDTFKPKTQFQEMLAPFSFTFDARKVYLLFGADNAIKDLRKGFDLLLEALSNIPVVVNKPDIEILVFGNQQEHEVIDCEHKIHFLGQINNDSELSTLYNLAHVSIVPSRIDNLPFVALESLACGTPVIGFNIGGLPDIVTNDQIGTLVPPFEVSALAEAIIDFINRPKTIDVIQACRARAMADYSVPMQVQRYMELAQELVGSKQ